MIIIDPVTLENRLFNIIITILAIFGYYRIRNPTILYIGVGIPADLSLKFFTVSTISILGLDSICHGNNYHRNG